MKPIQELTNFEFSLRFKENIDNSLLKVDYLHWHTNAEICTITEGECDFIINDKTYSANKGDIIVINSGQIHHFAYKGDCKITVCTSSPMFFYNLKININNIHPHITEGEIKRKGIDKKIHNCFKTMAEEINDTHEGSKIIFKANLLELYGLLLKHFEQKEVVKTKEFSRMIIFQKMLEYISENYTENLSLNAVSKKFNYSTAYVSAMLHSCTGVNFKSYLDNIRIQKAVELLLSTNMPITEISCNTGYENIRTFNNVFKKLIGKTPTQFRGESKRENINN